MTVTTKERTLEDKDRVFEKEDYTSLKSDEVNKEHIVRVYVALDLDEKYENYEIYANEEKIDPGVYEVSKDVTFTTGKYVLKTYKVNIYQPRNGHITVWNADTEIQDGDLVEHETELTIRFTTDAGYEGGRIYVNETELSGEKHTVTGETSISVKGIQKTPQPPYVPDPPYEDETVYYTVSLPKIEGASTTPEAGDYKVESWHSFCFYLTLDPAYDQSEPVVTTSRGEQIIPRTSDGAYIIPYVQSDMEIHIDHITKNPISVDNEKLNDHLRIMTQEGCVRIETNRPLEVAVYAMSGKLISCFETQIGSNVRYVGKGIYFIVIGKDCYKVMIK